MIHLSTPPFQTFDLNSLMVTLQWWWPGLVIARWSG